MSVNCLKLCEKYWLENKVALLLNLKKFDLLVITGNEDIVLKF